MAAEISPLTRQNDALPADAYHALGPEGALHEVPDGDGADKRRQPGGLGLLLLRFPFQDANRIEASHVGHGCSATHETKRRPDAHQTKER